MTDLIPPAALQHAAAKLRRMQDEYALDLRIEMVSDRNAKLVVEHQESGVRIWFAAERLGRRWRIRPPEGTEHDEPLDMSEGIEVALRLINAHEPGEAGAGAVTTAAPGSRSNSVETRRAAVIRT